MPIQYAFNSVFFKHLRTTAAKSLIINSLSIASRSNGSIKPNAKLSLPLSLSQMGKGKHLKRGHNSNSIQSSQLQLNYVFIPDTVLKTSPQSKWNCLFWIQCWMTKQIANDQQIRILFWAPPSEAFSADGGWLERSLLIWCSPPSIHPHNFHNPIYRQQQQQKTSSYWQSTIKIGGSPFISRFAPFSALFCPPFSSFPSVSNGFVCVCVQIVVGSGLSLLFGSFNFTNDWADSSTGEPILTVSSRPIYHFDSVALLADNAGDAERIVTIWGTSSCSLSLSHSAQNKSMLCCALFAIILDIWIKDGRGFDVITCAERKVLLLHSIQTNKFERIWNT